MKKVYMICDYTDDKAASIYGAPNVGVEHMGDCGGRLVHEDGAEIGRHHSSSFGWLRSDLKYHYNKMEDKENYELVDLIGKGVPDHLKKQK